MDVFRQFTWQMDNLTRELTVWQQEPGDLDYPACVPYRDGDAAGPQLVLDYHQRPVHMTLNTGSDYSYIGTELINASRERPESAVLTGINQPALGLGGESVSDGYLLGGLQFNQLPLGNMLVRENKQGALGLGMNFLVRFDRYLFLPDKMLFCYREQHFTRDEPLRCGCLPCAFTANGLNCIPILPTRYSPLACKMGMRCSELTPARSGLKRFMRSATRWLIRRQGSSR